MDTFAFLALLAAASLNAVVPGPGMLLAIGRSAANGIGAGIQVSIGMALATLVLIAVVWAVMAGMLILTDGGLALLRTLGIGVIVILALMLLFGRGSEAVAEPGLRAGRLARPQLGHLGGGLATGLTSPAHLIFLLALPDAGGQCTGGALGASGLRLGTARDAGQRGRTSGTCGVFGRSTDVTWMHAAQPQGRASPVGHDHLLRMENREPEELSCPPSWKLRCSVPSR